MCPTPITIQNGIASLSIDFFLEFLSTTHLTMGQCSVKQNIVLDETDRTDVDVSQVGGNSKSQHIWMMPTISKTTRRQKLVMNKRKVVKF